MGARAEQDAELDTCVLKCDDLKVTTAPELGDGAVVLSTGFPCFLPGALAPGGAFIVSDEGSGKGCTTRSLDSPSSHLLSH